MDLHIYKPDDRIRCALCGKEGKDHPATGQGCTDILEAIVKRCCPVDAGLFAGS